MAKPKENSPKPKEPAPGTVKVLHLSREHKMVLWAVWSYHRSKGRGGDAGDVTLFTPETLAGRFEDKFDGTGLSANWLKELADKRVIAAAPEHEGCYRMQKPDLVERSYREVEKDMGG